MTIITARLHTCMHTQLHITAYILNIHMKLPSVFVLGTHLQSAHLWPLPQLLLELSDYVLQLLFLVNSSQHKDSQFNDRSNSLFHIQRYTCLHNYAHQNLFLRVVILVIVAAVVILVQV